MANPGSKREKLGRQAAVKGTMLQAHLAWAEEHLGSQWRSILEPHLDAEAAVYAGRSVLATDWIPFWALIQVDRAIAAAGKEAPDKVFYALGPQSAIQNLKGAYCRTRSSTPWARSPRSRTSRARTGRSYKEEPHRYFEKAALLHGRFQNFGRAAYEVTGERACPMSLLEYGGVLSHLLPEQLRLLRGLAGDDEVADPPRGAYTTSAGDGQIWPF